MIGKIFTALCLAAAFIFAPFCSVRAAAESGACAEIVAEANTGRILYNFNGDRTLPMASTTKILTALIIIEDCDPDAIVTVPAECTGVEGSSIYLTPGEKISVKNLLYGLMLRSGNDCAETLAVYHSGSIEKFAERMNARASLIGARHSHFTNPHGLPDVNHYTTAEDLAMIACRSMRNPVFREIVCCKRAVVPDGGCGYARELINKNKFLYNYEGANGIKTGYTKAAGRCLVSSAEREGMQLVCVVLDCPDMYARSGALLDTAFEKYSYEKIFSADENIYKAGTEVCGKICRAACRDDFYYPVAEEEKNKFEIRAILYGPCRLPVFKGTELGELRIYLANQLIFSQKIYSIETVKKSWRDIVAELARSFCRNGELCGSTNFLRNAESQAGVDAIS